MSHYERTVPPAETKAFAKRLLMLAIDERNLLFSGTATDFYRLH